VTGWEAQDRADTFVPHAFDEQLADLGEIRMNYAVAGDPGLPALLLIPGQSESWWGYEAALPLLAGHFQAYAVDLRGQGRSTWTPGRYTLDNFGNDLVRFIDLVIQRPVIVSGLSSGGVLAAWLSAYARPGQVLAALYEDPPLFSSQVSPACGPSIRQGMGPVFAAWNKWLGDQWSIGDWAGLQRAFPAELPPVLLRGLAEMMPPPPAGADPGTPQNLREYDPEWGRSFVSGLASAGCDHAAMLSSVRVPVLFTHHFHRVDAETGHLLGAIADVQVQQVRALIEAAGQPFEYRSFPQMPHSMHGADPALYTQTLVDWVAKLG
jgi:pimeloyl-ACP methyl ester carboxylesterase